MIFKKFTIVTLLALMFSSADTLVAMQENHVRSEDPNNAAATPQFTEEELQLLKELDSLDYSDLETKITTFTEAFDFLKLLDGIYPKLENPELQKKIIYLYRHVDILLASNCYTPYSNECEILAIRINSISQNEDACILFGEQFAELIYRAYQRAKIHDLDQRFLEGTLGLSLLWKLFIACNNADINALYKFDQQIPQDLITPLKAYWRSAPLCQLNFIPQSTRYYFVPFILALVKLGYINLIDIPTLHKLLTQKNATEAILNKIRETLCKPTK